MLGRLRMDVGECIERYKLFMSTVFQSSWKGKTGDLLANGAYYDATLLENVVKAIVKEKLGSEDAKLIDDNKDGCKM
jgi:hypothetical protein